MPYLCVVRLDTCRLQRFTIPLPLHSIAIVWWTSGTSPMTPSAFRTWWGVAPLGRSSGATGMERWLSNGSTGKTPPMNSWPDSRKRLANSFVFVFV